MPNTRPGVQDHALDQDLAEALKRIGLDLKVLAAKCSEVILFGSRAVGCPQAKDWDLMLVSDQDLGLGEPFRDTAGGLNYRIEDFDIVVVTPDQTCDQRWLGWELAAHVSHYGVWLYGERGSWTTQTFTGLNSIRFRLNRIRHRQREMYRSRLKGGVTAEARQNLRREIRRLRYLMAGQAIPPRSILDAGPGPRLPRRN